VALVKVFLGVAVQGSDYKDRMAAYGLWVKLLQVRGIAKQRGAVKQQGCLVYRLMIGDGRLQVPGRNSKEGGGQSERRRGAVKKEGGSQAAGMIWW
jgi:hypothetical protein